jgi:hypothetical protein
MYVVVLFGVVVHASWTVIVLVVAVLIARLCPDPVPPVKKIIRPAHVELKPEPVSVVVDPPVAVPEAMPLLTRIVDPLRVIAMSKV